MRFTEYEEQFLVRHHFRKFVGEAEQTTRFDFEGETEIDRTADLEPMLRMEDMPEMLWWTLNVMVKQRHLPKEVVKKFETEFNRTITNFFDRLNEVATDKDWNVLSSLESFHDEDNAELRRIYENKPYRTIGRLVTYLSSEVVDDDLLFPIRELAPSLELRLKREIKDDDAPEVVKTMFSIKGMIFLDKARITPEADEEVVLRCVVESIAPDDTMKMATFVAEVIIFDNLLDHGFNAEEFFAENPNMRQPSTPDLIEEAETTTEDF